MLRSLRFAPVVALAACSLALPGRAIAADATPLAEGAKAPDFSLPSQEDTKRLALRSTRASGSSSTSTPRT